MANQRFFGFPDFDFFLRLRAARLSALLLCFPFFLNGISKHAKIRNFYLVFLRKNLPKRTKIMPGEEKWDQVSDQSDQILLT